VIYNLENEGGISQCMERISWLIEKKKKVDLKEVRKNRSNDQNRYLHKLFQIVADELGDTLEGVKLDIKIELGYYKTSSKGNKIVEQTSKMNTKVFSEFTDKFRNWSSSFHGIYLPSPEEYYRGETC